MKPDPTTAPVSSPEKLDDLLQFDREHIWHPYSSTTNPLPVYPVKSGQGVYLELEDGRRLIDGMSSWWCAIHGYNHPALNEAIVKQVGEISHVMFGGITHRPAIRLCQKLVELTPSALEKVFLCDSGSISVEVALKMALQYQVAVGRPAKSRIATIRGGYHGDTFGAMSVCDPVSGMHHLFSGLLAEQIFVDKPVTRFDESSLNPADSEALEATFREHHSEMAAFILEPIVQGAGGMYFYSPLYLRRLRELCDQYEVLLIVDEIATGFGRTGKLFAVEHADIQPDIMCLGKALTGGMMTMAATLCTSRIADGICKDDMVFMHGPTFMGNPLASNVALASLELLASEDWSSKVASIETWLKAGLKNLSAHPRVKETRVLGAIGVVECESPVNVAVIQKFFVEKDVWIRPFRNLIYLMPPYITNESEIAQLTHVISESLDHSVNFSGG